MEEGLTRKGELLLGGGIRLPEGFVLPCRVSHSTAGPGAGSGSAVFAFDRYRVKKTVSYDEGEFDLRVVDGEMSIWRDGTLVVDGVTIQPVIRHCPNQAFFNLDQHCMYNCAYCTSPLLPKELDKGLTTERIMEMLEESLSQYRFKTVAFTSGVVGSVGHTVDRMADAVRAVRETYPKMTIGVEPYITEPGQIAQLREAGANEIKINVECATRDIFERVCPDLDYDNTFAMLREAGVLRARRDRPGHRHDPREAVQDERPARPARGPHQRPEQGQAASRRRPGREAHGAQGPLPRGPPEERDEAPRPESREIPQHVLLLCLLRPGAVRRFLNPAPS